MQHDNCTFETTTTPDGGVFVSPNCPACRVRMEQATEAVPAECAPSRGRLYFGNRPSGWAEFIRRLPTALGVCDDGKPDPELDRLADLLTFAVATARAGRKS